MQYIIKPRALHKKEIQCILQLVRQAQNTVIHIVLEEVTADQIQEELLIIVKKKTGGEKCYIFAKARKIVWDGINYKFKRKASALEIKSKLEEWGFIGDSISSSSATTTQKITKKIEKKKEPKKVVKKYELKGERSIALSWEGYEDLIAGTVNFDETDYRGTLNIPLPNNDGTCDGTYSLQEGGKGTWQLACSNNMGAAGTLKWVKDGGVTGIGRDHNDKKVKFTVSKNS